jgi:periplasmic mercuric ion binding protein
MKTSFTWIALFIVVFASVAQEIKEPAKKMKNENVSFVVSMHCDACKTKIEKNVSWEKGVKDLVVDLDKKTVSVVYDPQKTSEDQVRKSIEKLGYSVEKQKTDATN